MMEVLHRDVPLRFIEKEFPRGAASSLAGIIKGSRWRERKKALADCTLHEIASRMIQRTDFEWSVVHQLSGHREGLRNRESCIQLPMQRKRPARHRCCSCASPQF